ncbi:MAG: DUF4339 domain-containing protein [Planctomycetota bacterium]|nr:DUF4339 domain-containing protein [Planctomycetota bacterium]
MQAEKYYIRVDGREEGPVTYRDMVELARGCTFNPCDEVRPEASDEWTRADTIPGLFGESQIHAVRDVPKGTGSGKVMRFQMACAAVALGGVCLAIQWLWFAPKRPNYAMARAWNEYSEKIKASCQELGRVRKEIQETFLSGKESGPADQWVADMTKAVNDLSQVSPGDFKIAKGHRKLIEFSLSLKALAVASHAYFERPGKERFAEVEKKFSESDKVLEDLTDWNRRFMKDNRLEVNKPRSDGK